MAAAAKKDAQDEYELVGHCLQRLETDEARLFSLCGPYDDSANESPEGQDDTGVSQRCQDTIILCRLNRNIFQFHRVLLCYPTNATASHAYTSAAA